MTKTADQVEMWKTLFKEERISLKIAASIISRRKGSTDSILDTAFEELQGRPFYEPFGLTSALRSVVKSAVACNLTVTDREGPLSSSVGSNDEDDVELLFGKPLMKLPWAERAVYFLREILKYSRRDTALLLSMSDAHVDLIQNFAKRRLKLPAQDLVELPTSELGAARALTAAISRT